MNNDNTFKVINENGAEKTYGRIPDLWHLAMAIQDGRDYGCTTRAEHEALAEKVLEVWHMAHDLKSIAEGQGQARIVDQS